MDEKIMLLMEETSCDRAEAELALELANYNLEKAIKTIRNILRNIAVIKGKFRIRDKNLYGLFIIILNKRFETAIRLRCVASYNPVVYETYLNMDWHELERAIYRYRLMEGTILSMANNVEAYIAGLLVSRKDRVFKPLGGGDLSQVEEAVRDGFPLGEPELHVVTEEINLEDYQVGSGKMEPVKYAAKLPDAPEMTKISLEVKLFEDEKGRKAANLSRGDIVLAQITDTREVAKYLTKLLCSKDPTYMPVSIEDKNYMNAGIEVLLHFTPRIVGYAVVSPHARVRVIREGYRPWWKRVFR